jgi:hypothetical protein
MDNSFQDALSRKMAETLVQLKKAGWVKRQGLKFGALVTAATGGWLVGKADGETAAALAAGAGALFVFLWEVVWSWIEVKTAAIETVKATNIEPPSNKAEMKQAVETITDKTPSTPTPPPTP